MPNHFTAQRAAKTATLAVVVAGVAAAALHGLPQRPAVAITATVHRDEATWAMPLDAYVAPATELSDQAEDLLVAGCLQKAGATDWVVPHRTVAGLIALDDTLFDASRANPSPNLDTTKPLTSAAAAARGYHRPSTAGANRAAWKAWAYSPARTTDLSALPAGTFDRCLRGARQQLGTPVSGATQEASDLAKRLTYLAALSARGSDSVVAADSKWRACMASAGVDHVTSAPSDMSSAAITAQFGLDAGGSVPTAAEIRLASTDAGCQATSGYRSALYDVEWSRLTKVTSADAAVLAKGSTGNPALTRRLERTIEAEQGGR